MYKNHELYLLLCFAARPLRIAYRKMRPHMQAAALESTVPGFQKCKTVGLPLLELPVTEMDSTIIIIIIQDFVKKNSVALWL